MVPDVVIVRHHNCSNAAFTGFPGEQGNHLLAAGVPGAGKLMHQAQLFCRIQCRNQVPGLENEADLLQPEPGPLTARDTLSSTCTVLPGADAGNPDDGQGRATRHKGLAWTESVCCA